MQRQKINRKTDKGVGRPKGRKALLRLPIKSLEETVEIVKTISEKGGDKMLPFEKMGSFIGLNPKQTAKTLGSMQKEYNLFNKELNNLYTLSDFGKRVAIGEFNAIKEMFSKSPILLDLFNQFGNRIVDEDGVEFYINRNYKVGTNKDKIIKRFLADKAYLEKLQTTKKEHPEEVSINPAMDAFKAIRIIDFFLPLKETKDEKTAINTLYGMAERNNWQSLFWLLEGLKNQPEGSIKKSANKIAEAFEKDYGIKITEEGFGDKTTKTPPAKKKDKGESEEGDLTGNQD